MSTLTPKQSLKVFCNLLALENGLDPGGHATAFDTLVLLEAPLPWRSDMYETAGTMPQEVIDVFERYAERYRETGVWPAHYIFLIAPDERYSRPEWRRVLIFQRDRDQIANFARTEYHVPQGEAGKLIWTLSEEQEKLSRFEEWKTTVANPPRDLLVCTHGTVDVACAKFGFPLYRHLRRNHAAEHLRVWRASHFGGHVFAPTLMDLPSGHYWAYVEEGQAAQIVRQDGPVADLRGHYRGWAGLESGFLQAAEREMWLREGWRWLSFPKQGAILAQDSADTPAWAEVCILFTADDGQHAYKAHVEMTHQIEMIHTTGYEGTYPYPQYKVTCLERIS